MTEEAHSSTHPPLPPTTEETLFSRLRLLRSRRVGPVNFYRLLSEYGSAQNALEALPKMARAAGFTGYETCPEPAVAKELSTAKAAKARLLCFDDPLYPAPLSQLGSAPPLIWAIGDLHLLTRPMIAIVGARNASSLGTRMARSLAKDLGAAGYAVVSGLARGIDTAAHLASLDSGTIAVLAGGCDVIYPPQNTSLAENIAAKGLILSEQPMGQTPQARHFPARNRIIAGLSLAVIVVEAAGRSGSLITARDALDLGRDVLAVPGHPFDARAYGCNALIRDGAILVRNAEDVIAALPPLGSDMQPSLPEAPVAQAAADLFPPDTAPPARRHKAQDRLGQPSALSQALSNLPAAAPEIRSLQETAALHQQILARLGPSPTASEQVMRDLKVSPQTFSPAITELELEGKIERFPGGFLARHGTKP
ncbi:DNA-processing protein DprA [Pseudophaeobacter flagellatus]|uniref:DNA-processing protein DprA n=1 Tax=Pseudophaeobacter flagellatus TaxID=2899119 RepID=UPI001E5643DE|nr:DNA-processing protein DprA [Pseudophaeobacter flagellatus]MCD9148431.1 DNA-processing protein DprA [Pseudophaeobacter flagellatus]